MVKFNCKGKGLITFKGIIFPENVTELDCSENRLTSLEHCPLMLQN